MRRRALLGSAGSIGLIYLAGASARASTEDALLAPWGGPHGGLPPFGRFTPAELQPALQKAMLLQRAEVAAITDNPAAPNFANTIAALEDSGRVYGRVNAMYSVCTSTMNDKPMQLIQSDTEPMLAAFSDELSHDAKLFARIQAVYDQRNSAGLTPEQQRLVEVRWRAHVREGAALDGAGKARAEAINQRLATLYTDFGQHQLADEEQGRLVIDRLADLDGLPEGLRADAAAAAEAAGLKGRWLIANTRSSMEPFITYADRRELREQGWRLWTRRGDNGDANDNKAVIGEILQLRAERARLFGYASYAHWALDDNMAKTPDAAMALMMKVWAAAVARVRIEVADMQAMADAAADAAGTPKQKIEAWDYRYYAEKVRKVKYDLDDAEIKPYLQLEKIREAMFWSAGQLYGLSFHRLAGVAVIRPEITVYEVRRSNRRVGLWYFDPYARPGKNSGAWMSEYRTQEAFEGLVTPIVSNNANFVPGRPGEPVLISWDDAETMFHEFGHALHGLSSMVQYPSLAGTNTLRDFVEFPSQLNEHWLPTPEVLSRFALHYKTGRPMPAALVEKIRRAQRFNQGFGTAEYLAAAIYDMKVHLAPAEPRIDPDAFEAETMKAIGCPPEVVMRHRPTHFGHIFSGEEYAAGYYAYLWADTLTADAAEAFTEAGSFYDKAVARRLHDCIMSVGNSIPPELAFRRFRGRDVDVEALMRMRGFSPSRTPTT